MLADRPLSPWQVDDEMVSVTSASSSEGFQAEAERQLEAVAERHREAVSSMAEPGRPEAGQYVAIKVVGRAVGAVTFALRRAAEADVPFDRLRELTDRMRADVELDLDLDGEARPPLGPEAVEDLHDRLEAAWHSWRHGLGRGEP